MKQHQLYGCTFSNPMEFRQTKITGLNQFHLQMHQVRMENFEKWRSLGKQQLPKKNIQQTQQTANFELKNWQRFRPQKLSQNLYYDQIRAHSPKCFRIAGTNSSKNQEILSPLKSLNDQSCKKGQNSFQANFKKYQSSIKRYGSLEKNIEQSQIRNPNVENRLNIRRQGSLLANESSIGPNTKNASNMYFREENLNYADFGSAKDTRQQISRIFNQPSERILKQCTSRNELYNLISMVSKSDIVVEDKLLKQLKSKLVSITDSLQSQRQLFNNFKLQIQKEVKSVLSFCFNSLNTLKNQYQKQISNLKNTINKYENEVRQYKLGGLKEVKPSDIFKMNIPQLKSKIPSFEDSDSGLSGIQKDKNSKTKTAKKKKIGQRQNPFQFTRLNIAPENSVKPLHLNNPRGNSDKTQKVDEVTTIKNSQMQRRHKQDSQRVKICGESPSQESKFQRAKSFQKLFETLETMKNNAYSRTLVISKQDCQQLKMGSPKKNILKASVDMGHEQLIKYQHIL